MGLSTRQVARRAWQRRGLSTEDGGSAPAWLGPRLEENLVKGWDGTWGHAGCGEITIEAEIGEQVENRCNHI